MRKLKKKYTFFQKASAVFLMLTLLWLTVSTPFIITNQQSKQNKSGAVSAANNTLTDGEDSETDSSTNNNVDEKTPNNSLSEEYLHEQEMPGNNFFLIVRCYKFENAGTYIAFHGELHAPPPNAA